MALTAAELRVIVEASVKDAITDINKVGTAVDQTGQKGQTAGRNWQNAGRAITASGAAIGAGFSVAVQEGATFQQQLADINTVARLSAGDTQALGDAIQQASRDTGISTEELTASMYDLVSAGTVTSEQLHSDLAGSMEVVSSAANLAIGGMGNLAGTTDVLTSALNAYGLDASHAAEVTDIMAVAIERGKVTADEIGASIANVAPIAANAGIELEEISAAYSTLTANGVPAAEATTQMRAAIVALLSPNEKLKDIMADTGINFAEVAKEEGLQVALQKLRDVTIGANESLDKVVTGPLTEFPERLKENQEALGLTNSEMETLVKVAGKDGASAAYAELTKMVAAGDAGLSDALGRVEGFNFLLQTTGENAGQFGEDLTAAMDATGTAAEQAEIRMEGPVEQAKRMAQNVLTFVQDVGGPFASTFGPILLMFNQLAPAMGGLIRPATALGGLIGGGLAKGMQAVLGQGRLLNAASAAGFGLGRFARIVTDGITSLGNFVIGMGKASLSAIRFAAVMTAQAVAAVGKFVFAMAVSAVGAVASFATAIFTTAIPAVVALAAPFLPIILVVGAVVAAVAALFLAWQNNFLGIRDIAANVWDAITGIIGGAIDFISGVIGGFVAFLGTIWNGFTEAAEFVWNLLYTIIGKYLEIITFPIRTFIGFVMSMWDGFAEVTETVWNIVKGVIDNIVGIITGIIGGLIDVVGGVWDAVSGFFDFVTGGAAEAKAEVASVQSYTPTGQYVTANRGGVPTYQRGALFTQEGLAYLHRGETVLPPSVAAPLREYFKGGPDTGAGVEGPRRPSRDTGEGTVIEHLEVTVPVQGLLRAESPRDIVEIMRRAAQQGYIIPRKPRGAGI